MSRRASLPGAAELFRATAGALAVAPDSEPEGSRESSSGSATALEAVPAHEDTRPERAAEASKVRSVGRARRSTAGERTPSGRERHDEKITVYLAPEELVDLEHARLSLRAEHGLAVDRGRIVREAVAVVLADLEAKGESSILVRRLRGR